MNNIKHKITGLIFGMIFTGAISTILVINPLREERDIYLDELKKMEIKSRSALGYYIQLQRAYYVFLDSTSTDKDFVRLNRFHKWAMERGY